MNNPFEVLANVEIKDVTSKEWNKKPDPVIAAEEMRYAKFVYLYYFWLEHRDDIPT